MARTQELVRNILNSSVDGIISTDTQGCITLFNRAAERIFGYTEPEVLGRRVREFYEGGAEEAARVMIKLYADEVLSDHRATIIAKSGELVPLRVSASLLRDEERTILGTMASFQDLRVEEALKQEMASRDQFFVSIMQASMDGLVTLDGSGRIVSWNRGASGHLRSGAGACPRAAHGRFPAALAHPRAPLERRRPHGHAPVRGEPGPGAAARVWTSSSRAPRSAGRAEARGSSLVLKDVTELKRLQRDLATAENLAELGRLAASVAHEIKNPIAGLRGAMEMMSGVHQPDDPRFAVFQEALAQMRRLDSLVKDLLSFAKPVAVRREATPLGLVLEACMPFVLPSAKEAGVRLDMVVREALPDVLADPQQLQQVFVNLLLNAVQATPNGGLVRLSNERRNGYLAVSVTDTGCGIKPELMANIFKPFFTTKHIGTGLGLSIVKRIVNAHGGRIEIQSEAGEGSTFTVLLPVAAGSS